FSVRGGLLDVFPPSAPAPYRIDFFDDEIDSIRVFDPETQRSVEDVERVRIGPAREVPPVDDEAALARIQEAVARQVETLRPAGAVAGADALAQRARTHLDHLAGRRWAPGLEQYKPFLFPELETLLDYAGPDATVIVDEPARTREQLQLMMTEFAETHADLLERGRVLPEQQALFADWDDWAAAGRRRPALFVWGCPSGCRAWRACRRRRSSPGRPRRSTGGWSSSCRRSAAGGGKAGAPSSSPPPTPARPASRKCCRTRKSPLATPGI